MPIKLSGGVLTHCSPRVDVIARAHSRIFLPPPSTPETGRAIIALCNAVHPGHLPPNTLQDLSKTTQSGAQVQSKTKRETCMLEFGSEGAPA
jgi:hypothetical protein